MAANRIFGNYAVFRRASALSVKPMPARMKQSPASPSNWSIVRPVRSASFQSHS